MRSIGASSRLFYVSARCYRCLPDLIICDLNMPRLSGYDLLPLVRRRFPDIPVIVVTGDPDQPLLPADAVYVKGNDQPNDLMRTVAKLVKSKAPSLSN